MKLPQVCPYCDERFHHYGSCRCPRGQLDAIEFERRALTLRLAKLDEREAEERVRLDQKSRSHGQSVRKNNFGEI